MLDVSKPVKFITPKGNISVNVRASEEMIEESLKDRGNPNYVYVAKVSYRNLLRKKR